MKGNDKVSQLSHTNNKKINYVGRICNKLSGLDLGFDPTTTKFCH